MAYKTISVVVTDQEADHDALMSAFNLAVAGGAHLDVHCIGIDPARFEAVPIGSAASLAVNALEDARQSAEELAAWVTALLPKDYGPLAIIPSVVPQMGIEAMVARLAGYCDIVVAAKPYGPQKNPLHVTVLEAELFGSGAPVLVIPQGEVLSGEPFRQVLVAWNESSESFAAIRAALPVLKQAHRVHIVMVDPPAHSPERSDPGGAICLMLARHGVKAEVSILARTMPRISEVLTRFAIDHAIDAIVMGAYGHSRFRESILGGATRDMLEHTKIPLIMAH